jgi:peptidoglycan-associated lipoprotein
MTIHREQRRRARVISVMTRPKFLLVVLVGLSACGSKAVKKQSVPSPSASVATNPPPATEPVAASPNVGVSDDLAKQCGLRFANADQAPKFGYDDDELLPSDRDVLTQVAECLVRGPLHGKTVQLVGRADPRGTDEYNLGLGTRRAETVRSFLLRLGVPNNRLSPTTRGELDASGVDELSWQRDRRVDLQLVN